MSRRHTITLSHEAFEKLRNRGVFGETYSQVIARLVDDAEVTKEKPDND
jgi:predicted CopG family antitoxin